MEPHYSSKPSSGAFHGSNASSPIQGTTRARPTRPLVTGALRLEIVRRHPNAVGFEVIKKRWVVEQTFSWFGRNRRLAKDFENLAATLLAFVTLAAIQFGIRRLARS